MSKASKKLLSELHGRLAAEMKKLLEEGVTVVDDDGKPVKITPGASHMNVIRQFLKDNNVENIHLADELNEAAKPKVALPFSTQADEYGMPN